MIAINADNLLFMVPIAAVIALVFAFYFYRSIWKIDKGTPAMQKISDAIETGAMAYLRRQYRTIAIISVIIAIILLLAGFIPGYEKYMGYKVAIAFLIGAGFSILSGYIGMRISVNTNVRTASAGKKSLNDAFVCAFRGGAISGIAVSTLSLAGLFCVVLAYNALIGGDDLTNTMHAVVGYAFGASMAALFAQLGGGIYTKAADVGADLVGKVEQGIPEDDPRNPAVIADLVGDNVGDCAGRGADIFESTAAEIIGAMVIGVAVYKISPLMANNNWVLLPLVIMAFGLIASLVGILTVKMRSEDADVIKTLNGGYYVTLALVLITMAFAVYWLLKDLCNNWWYFVLAGVFGMLLGLAIVYITQYYTGDHKPVHDIAEASKTGAATNVIQGLANGMESTVLPAVCIVFAIIITYELGYYAFPDFSAGNQMVMGLYGTAIATVTMLASSAFILAEDTFGPITDNAGGIAEMAELPEEVRDITDTLDSVGNTTAAVGKGLAIGSAALTALALFVDYANATKLASIDLKDPQVMIGLFIGGLLPFLFSAFAIQAVSRAAEKMIEEVRRQFREIVGIMEGKADPDYATCVGLCTKGALHEMVVPALLAIIVPIATGLILGPTGVVGLLGGVSITGFAMAVFMSNAGGAWDNAKKYIERGNHGGKGSEQHKAAVVGDTVGDPFKDTSGPSLNILIKLCSTVSIVFSGLVIAFNLAHFL